MISSGSRTARFVLARRSCLRERRAADVPPPSPLKRVEKAAHDPVELGRIKARKEADPERISHNRVGVLKTADDSVLDLSIGRQSERVSAEEQLDANLSIL
jgi:hypothetical protein